MNETSMDEQDLAKALDSVAQAASNLDSSPQTPPPPSSPSNQPTNPPGAASLPPIVPPDSPVAPTAVSGQNESDFPKITPIHDSSDVFYKPQLSSVPNQKPEEKPAVATEKPVQTEEKKPTAAPAEEAKTTDKPAESSPNENKPADDNEPAVDESLADIKKVALTELRPLVDKLDVSPEEKFDTLLLLIRSTDDPELIAPAHEAAKNIADEARRAEALLDIVKEIDYLSRQKSDQQEN